MQLPVVLFASPVWGSACSVMVGGSVLPIYWRVCWRCSGEPGLLQPLVHFLLLRQAPRVWLPDLGVDGVLVLVEVVMDEEVLLRVFLDGVLDVVELLAGCADAVVEGVVVLGRGGRWRRGLGADPCMSALLPTPPHAPQQHRSDRQSPDDDHCGNQQRDEVVCWTETSEGQWITQDRWWNNLEAREPISPASEKATE